MHKVVPDGGPIASLKIAQWLTINQQQLSGRRSGRELGRYRPVHDAIGLQALELKTGEARIRRKYLRKVICSQPCTFGQQEAADIHFLTGKVQCVIGCYF